MGITPLFQRRRLQDEAPPTEEDCGSPVVQWGDGVCDARLNTEACDYDGGKQKRRKGTFDIIILVRTSGFRL